MLCMLGCYKTFDCEHERPTRVRKRTLRERPLLDSVKNRGGKTQKAKDTFWWSNKCNVRGAAYSRWAPYNTVGCARFAQYPCWHLIQIFLSQFFLRKARRVRSVQQQRWRTGNVVDRVLKATTARLDAGLITNTVPISVTSTTFIHV